MGKVLDLRDVFLRSSEDSFDCGDDQLFYWNGDSLVEIQGNRPFFDDETQVNAMGSCQ